jgi:phage tail sheath protein FI
MPTYLSPGVYIEEVPSSVQAIAGASTSTAAFLGIVPDSVSCPEVNPNFDPTLKPTPVVASAPAGKARNDLEDSAASPPPPDASDPRLSPFRLRDFRIGLPVCEPRLFTNFTEFQSVFGDFSTDSGHRNLSHAVFGFFNNGGAICYVIRITSTAQIEEAMRKLEPIDEISIVAAPGMVDDVVRAAILAHCESAHWFGILDTEETVTEPPDASMLPPVSKNLALYFPWFQVFDPATKIMDPSGKGTIYAPPSGHVAGIYARVDRERGVHKAPANEKVMGALGLRYSISKAQQGLLNPLGINCIRKLNGNITVWGARTIGGYKNGEFTYVNVRRLLLFLRKSIENGTQWVVFEPNDQFCWAKVTRNVSQFLTIVYNDGALFGETPAQAFFVKCDKETNPPERRELGQLTAIIGVAPVRPAEFVIFKIMQWSAPEPQ